VNKAQKVRRQQILMSADVVSISVRYRDIYKPGKQEATNLVPITLEVQLLEIVRTEHKVPDRVLTEHSS
jgi:hypothetical protein